MGHFLTILHNLKQLSVSMCSLRWGRGYISASPTLSLQNGIFPLQFETISNNLKQLCVSICSSRVATRYFDAEIFGFRNISASPTLSLLGYHLRTTHSPCPQAAC